MSPPKFYFSEPMMSWDNIKHVSETLGLALHSAHNHYLTWQQHSQKKRCKTWAFSVKNTFLTSLFGTPFANFWSSSPESLYDTAVCDSLHQF